ncbi:hypothetical protein QQ045_012534 [Rhodiola kirilowii]
MNKKNEPVCVTGANGFIGSWLVRTLIDHGYTHINASIFPGSDASHLTSLSTSSSSIQIRFFQAHLLDSDALSQAIQGCSGVFHVASPCTLDDPSDPINDLINPAVQGTINVLDAARTSGVTRVVLTSSISALVPNPSWPSDKPFDESSWTDLDYCRSRKKWYPVSKTLAEKAAWEFGEKHGIDIVAIHPSTCLGPLLQSSLNASCAVLQQLLRGSADGQEYHWLGAVHVKDVAAAQVLLFETPTASGRYLCTNGIYQFREFAEKVAQMFPQFPIHRFQEDTQPGMMSCDAASKRLIELGVKFTPIEEAICDTVTSLKARGFLEEQQT